MQGVGFWGFAAGVKDTRLRVCVALFVQGLRVQACPHITFLQTKALSETYKTLLTSYQNPILAIKALTFYLDSVGSGYLYPVDPLLLYRPEQ